MEEKKNHLSLPSNYVTLAQLKERWLKEKERKDKEKEIQEKQEQLQNLQQQKLQRNRQKRKQDQHQAKLTTQTQRRGADFRTGTRNRSRKEFRPKYLNGSETNRSTIEVSSENHEKLEAKAEITGENADKDSKGKKFEKTQKVKRNHRADKDKDKNKKENGTTQGTVEARTDGEVENFDVKKDHEKTTIKNEFDRVVEGNVEEKFRDLSMSCESDNQKARFRRYSGFGSTQRNNGSHSYGGYRERFARRELSKSRRNKMVWIRKDGATSGGNIAGIETSSGCPVSILRERF